MVVNIDKETHYAVKLEALKTETTIAKVLQKAVKEYFENKKKVELL